MPSAGLGACANAQQAVVLSAAGEALTLRSRERGREVVARIDLGDARLLHRRLVRTPEAGFRFSYKTDQDGWKPVITLLGYDPVHRPNALTRIALFATGEGACFGHVEIRRW